MSSTKSDGGCTHQQNSAQELAYGRYDDRLPQCEGLSSHRGSEGVGNIIGT